VTKWGRRSRAHGPKRGLARARKRREAAASCGREAVYLRCWAIWCFLSSVLAEGKGLPPGLSAAAGGVGPKGAVRTYVHEHIVLTVVEVGKEPVMPIATRCRLSVRASVLERPVDWQQRRT
jgi:hypothetical protein